MIPGRNLNLISNPPAKRPSRMDHDGYVKVRPLTEGYSVKGGQNPPTSQIGKRPPPPPPTPRPGASKK